MEDRYILNYDLKSKRVSDIRFKQGNVDTSVLEVTLFDNGLVTDITGEIIEFRFAKPDNTVVYQDADSGVSILDVINGKVQCILRSNTLTSPGIVKCEIHRSKAGKELTTPTFNFVVQASIGQSNMFSTNYISSIENALINIRTAETIRASAEDKRVINENKRIIEFTNLKTDVTTGVTLHTNMKDVITIGTKLDIALKSDIDRGNSLDTSLKADILSGTALETTLKGDIISGNDIKTALEIDINSATTKKNDLQTVIAAANTTTYGTQREIDLVNSQLSEITYNAISLGLKGDGITDETSAISTILNALPNGSTIIFPKGYTFYVTNYILLLNKKNVIITGSAIFKYSSTKMLFRFDNCSNCKMSNLTVQDINYTDNLYFNNVLIDYSTINVTDSNNNVDITKTDSLVTLIPKGTATIGAVYYGNTDAISLDISKDYTLQVVGDIVSSGANFSVPKLVTVDINDVETIMNFDNQVSTGAYIYRRQTMYIPKNTKSIYFKLATSKLYNSSNGAVTYDISKIKLYSFTKDLPDNIDNYSIGAMNSSNIAFDNLSFIGMKVSCISTLGAANNNITISNCKAMNCFMNGFGLSYVNNGKIINNYVCNRLLAENGDIVFYTKTSFRGYAVLYCNNVTVDNNYAEGTFFYLEAFANNNFIVTNCTSKNLKWGLSINISNGILDTNILSFRDNYIMGLELVGCDMITSNMKILGNTFWGTGISISNAIVKQVFDNIFIEKAMAGIGYNTCDITVLNTTMTVYGVGIIDVLRNKPNYNLFMSNVTISLHVLAFGNTGYAQTFISCGSLTNPYNLVMLSDVACIGTSKSLAFIIYTNIIKFNNVDCPNPSNNHFNSLIYLCAIPNVISVVQCCRLNGITINSTGYNAQNSTCNFVNSVLTAVALSGLSTNFVNSNSCVGTLTWQPAKLAHGNGETSIPVTITGVTFGDYVMVSAPYDLQGITCNAYVSAINTVKIRLQNETGSVINLASGVWKVKVIK
jgi:hypothetical protein